MCIYVGKPLHYHPGRIRLYIEYECVKVLNLNSHVHWPQQFFVHIRLKYLYLFSSADMRVQSGVGKQKEHIIFSGPSRLNSNSFQLNILQLWVAFCLVFIANMKLGRLKIQASFQKIFQRQHQGHINHYVFIIHLSYIKQPK